MNNEGAYIGSMAFNQYLTLEEDINLNTGSFQINKSLVNLPGINNTINLNLSLRYSNAVPGVLNLPNNWSFNIPYVIPNETLTCDNGTYIIDSNWADQTNYKSGLRYVNHHGIKFEQIVPPQPLPSGNFGQYSYLYRYSDGSHDYFDETGKLLEHDDIYGNSNYFFYEDQFSGVLHNYLREITDSYGQKVKFEYSPNAFTVLLPNSQKIVINYSSNGVENIVDELGNITSFTYSEESGYSVIIQINYAVGLITQLTYTALSYRTSSGDATFPAVSSLLHIGVNQSFLNNTTYAYGLNTNGSTYTGFNVDYMLSGSNDGLMDSNNTLYIYDISVSVLDEQSKLLAYSEYYYNFLHSLVTNRVFLLDDSNSPQKCYQTSNVYCISTDWYSRSINYNKPINSEVFVWSSEKNQYIPMRQSKNTYDEYGNPLSVDIIMFNETTQSYELQSTSKFTYVVASWGGEMPSTSINQDVITGYSQQTSYTLTTDEKSVASYAVTYQKTPTSNWLPWKEKSYLYDNNGRRLTETFAWSQGATNPNADLESSSTNYSYSYNSSNNTLIVTKKDALNNTSINVINVSYPNQILVKTENQLGQVNYFEYDPLGRLTSTKDPMGNVSTIEYACQEESGYNRIKTVSEIGYITEVYCDELGRQIKIIDNGDSAQGTTQTANRVLSQTTYNALGLTIVSTGILKLSTYLEYDALGRLLSTTDPHNNVTTINYLDSKQLTTVGVNGVKQLQQIKDSMGRPIVQSKFANPSDNKIDYFINQTIGYNGLGQVISVDLQKCLLESDQSTLLNSLKKTYDANGNITNEVFIGYDSQRADASKTISRDLFGNVSSYSKNVTYYADKRNYTFNSDVFVFNVCNNLISQTNNLKQTESYTYFANGKIASYKRFDGTEINYNYDANNNLKSLGSGDAVFEYTYYADNKLESVAEAGKKISYQYYIDGVLQQTIYPEGKVQTIIVDQYSRIVQVNDFSGTSTSISYNQVGQITKKQFGDNHLSCIYDVVNSVNDILVATTVTGTSNINYSYCYDGFGRMLESKAKLAGQSSNLFDCSYTYDVLERLLSIKNTFTKDSGNHSIQNIYTYDGFGQVIEQNVIEEQNASPSTKVTYTYDGNTNVISKTTNQIKQEFNYNAIDQLVIPGVEYDTNGRLIKDDVGNQYIYNVFDKVVNISNSNLGVAINYSYYPDGLISTRTEGVLTDTFYYYEGTVNLIHSITNSNENWQKYFFHGNTRLASFDNNNNADYYLTANNSTVGVYNGSDLTSLQYDAYGANITEPDVEVPNFAWKQEYANLNNDFIYLRSRFYNARLMRFMTMDTYSVSNKYVFGNGNPIDNIDPTGHMSQAAALGIGIGVGTVATIATGGALGVVAGPGMLASIGVGAVAGAVGSVAGDATIAGLSGQKFTGERALTDILVGAVGGAVGAGVGSGVGRGAIYIALKGGLNNARVSITGALSAGISGGIAGSIASSGVTSAMYGQPFFSSSTLLNMVIGGVAGLGAGILGGGLLTRDAMPGRIGGILGLNILQGIHENGSRVIDFSPSDGDNITDENLTAGDRNAVIIHGSPGNVHPEIIYENQVYRPFMDTNEFANILRNNGFQGRDMNLWSCYAGRLGLASVAQKIATQLNINVYAPASLNTINLQYNGTWIRYTP